jgi:hypothetical protein
MQEYNGNAKDDLHLSGELCIFSSVLILESCFLILALSQAPPISGFHHEYIIRTGIGEPA